MAAHCIVPSALAPRMYGVSRRHLPLQTALERTSSWSSWQAPRRGASLRRMPSGPKPLTTRKVLTSPGPHPSADPLATPDRDPDPHRTLQYSSSRPPTCPNDLQVLSKTLILVFRPTCVSMSFLGFCCSHPLVTG